MVALLAIERLKQVLKWLCSILGCSMPSKIAVSNHLATLLKLVLRQVKQLLVILRQHTFFVSFFVLDEVHREDFLGLPFRHLFCVAVKKHLHMILEERQGSLDLLFNDKLADVGLCPEKREGSSDLRIGVQLSVLALISDDYLLKLHKVGNIAVLVNTAVEETSATTLSAASTNQDQVKLTLTGALTVNETLHQMGAPELRHVLRLYLVKHVAVPREVVLYHTFGLKAMLII